MTSQIYQDFFDAVAHIQTDADKLRDVVQGDDQTTVQTVAGVLDSVAKTIKDIETAINSAGGGWLAQAQTAAGNAESAEALAQQWAAAAQNAVAGAVMLQPDFDASTASDWPASPGDGYIYRVSVAGTVNGETLYVDDTIIYDGTAWQVWRTGGIVAAANLIGAISDTTHGQRGGGNLHAAATASVAGFLPAADKAKLNRIAVTGAVNLDAINTRVSQLDQSVTLQGEWSPAGGSFPASTMAGESWIASAAGTIDGVEFAQYDQVIALVDNASASTYADNWLLIDNSDKIVSVAGQTGIVTLDGGDVGLANVRNVASYSQTEANGRYLGKTAKAANSAQLNGKAQGAGAQQIPTGAQIGTIRGRDLTISTGNPTGGADGDIWLKI